MNDVTLANDITVTEKRPVVCIVGTLREPTFRTLNCHRSKKQS
ncbi:MAG: hypothetical protein RLZZ184_2552 [Cyanobacteriota bacterium]